MMAGHRRFTGRLPIASAIVLAVLSAATLIVAWLFPGGDPASHIHPERDANAQEA